MVSWGEFWGFLYLKLIHVQNAGFSSAVWEEMKEDKMAATIFDVYDTNLQTEK